jgi:hypothetical protein
MRVSAYVFKRFSSLNMTSGFLRSVFRLFDPGLPSNEKAWKAIPRADLLRKFPTTHIELRPGKNRMEKIGGGVTGVVRRFSVGA